MRAIAARQRALCPPSPLTLAGILARKADARWRTRARASYGAGALEAATVVEVKHECEHRVDGAPLRPRIVREDCGRPQGKVVLRVGARSLLESIEETLPAYRPPPTLAGEPIRKRGDGAEH